MANIKDKKEALKIIEALPEEVVKRLAELSTNKKAIGYFSNPIKFALVKGFLK